MSRPDEHPVSGDARPSDLSQNVLTAVYVCCHLAAKFPRPTINQSLEESFFAFQDGSWSRSRLENANLANLCTSVTITTFWKAQISRLTTLVAGRMEADLDR
jgi:hypothetical protein